MYRRSRTDGATVLELLISSTLLLAMLAAAYSMILPMIKAHYRHATRIGLQEELMVALRKITLDLQGCTSGGVGLMNGMISLHPLADYQPNAAPNDRVPMSGRFADHVIIYYRLNNRLYRHEYPYNTTYAPWTSMGGTPAFMHPERPTTAAWADFLSYFTTHYNQDRLIAADVVSFQVTSASNRALQFPLELVLKNQRMGPSGEPISYECKQKLILNNAR